MAALEKIVRPFQTDARVGGFSVPSSRGTADNVVLQYGKSGGGAEILQSHYSLEATWYMTKKWNEYAPGRGSGDPFSSEGMGYEPTFFT